MTTDAVGGVWRYSVDLGRALRTRGFAPTLAVMGPAPSGAQADEAAAAGLPVIHGDYRLEWMPDAAADVQRAGWWLLSLADTLRPEIVHLNGYAHAALPWAQPAHYSNAWAHRYGGYGGLWATRALGNRSRRTGCPSGCAGGVST